MQQHMYLTQCSNLYRSFDELIWYGLFEELSDTVDVVESSGVPKGTKTEEHGREKECTITYCTEKYRYLTLKDVRCCYHVSCVNSELAWVSWYPG